MSDINIVASISIIENNNIEPPVSIENNNVEPSVSIENNNIEPPVENNSSESLPQQSVIESVRRENDISDGIFSDDSEITQNDAMSTGSQDAVRSSQRSSGRLSQSSFVSLKDTDYTIIEHEIVPGYRKNSKLLYADEQFYVFNTKCALGDSYVCVNHNCNARVYIVVSTQCIRLTGASLHNHETKNEEFQKLKCLNEMKSRCGQLTYLLSSQKVTVRDIFYEVLAQ